MRVGGLFAATATESGGRENGGLELSTCQVGGIFPLPTSIAIRFYTKGQYKAKFPRGFSQSFVRCAPPPPQAINRRYPDADPSHSLITPAMPQRHIGVSLVYLVSMLHVPVNKLPRNCFWRSAVRDEKKQQPYDSAPHPTSQDAHIVEPQPFSPSSTAAASCPTTVIVSLEYEEVKLDAWGAPFCPKLGLAIVQLLLHLKQITLPRPPVPFKRNAVRRGVALRTVGTCPPIRLFGPAQPPTSRISHSPALLIPARLHCPRSHPYQSEIATAEARLSLNLR